MTKSNNPQNPKTFQKKMLAVQKIRKKGMESASEHTEARDIFSCALFFCQFGAILRRIFFFSHLTH
jgi:hypothetical protein